MFNVILSNGVEDITLEFKLRNTDIARKWFSEISKNYKLYETNRFSNWGNNNYIDRLNYHIDIINTYDNIIDSKVTKCSTQQDLNYLHKFFEDLRGDVVTGTVWYNNAPQTIKHSINEFNILIHQFESYLRTKNKHPTVVVTFKDRPTISLNKNDMEHFTFKWTSGTVYINYCQTGKTILDVFKDRDNIANGIRPQEYYSADFMIKFGKGTSWVEYIFRKLYILLWVRFKNFKFNNLNLGMIPVADLKTKIDTTMLFKFNIVKEIVCIK